MRPKRDPNARRLREGRQFLPRVERNRKAYRRKTKHKESFNE